MTNAILLFNMFGVQFVTYIFAFVKQAFISRGIWAV